MNKNGVSKCVWSCTNKQCNTKCQEARSFVLVVILPLLNFQAQLSWQAAECVIPGFSRLLKQSVAHSS